MDKLIERINFLYKKSQSEGLSEEEKSEQAQLRSQYVKAFRQGTENALKNVYILDKKGNKKKLEKKHR